MFWKQKNQKAVCEEGAHSRRPRGCQWGAGWAAEKWEPSLGQEVGWGAGGRGSVGSWAGADPCSPGAPESRRPEPARRGGNYPELPRPGAGTEEWEATVTSSCRQHSGPAMSELASDTIRECSRRTILAAVRPGS